MSMPVELREGYVRFRRERYVVEAARYREAAKGQSPRTMIVACADSRVDPATIFSAAPGELFVVRNVAALVPPQEETGTYHGTSAALEFAVTQLKVQNIVVMGHALCGGVAASLMVAEHRPVGRFIGPWVAQINGIRDELLAHGGALSPAAQQQALERMAVQYSLDNLMTFSFVERAVADGQLQLNGAWFSIAEGELRWLNRDAGVFERIETDPVEGPPAPGA